MALFLRRFLPVVLAGTMVAPVGAQVSASETPSIGTIPRFTGTSSIGNSLISASGTNVGIGTATPQATLEVNGTGLFDWVSDTGTVFLGDTNHGIKSTAGSGVTMFTYQVPNGIFLQQATGYVGIGTNTPTALLHLQGSFTGFLGGAKLANSTYADNASTGVHLDFVNDSDSQNVGAKLQLVRVGSYDQSDLAFSTKNVASAGDNSTEKMRLTSTGNVGIGVANPGEKLELNGNIKLSAGADYHIVFSDGSVQDHAWDGVLESADYAESVDVTGERGSFEPGDLLVINPRDEEVPMAMVGIVPTKVSTENGPIRDGDLLVSSSIPGYAMKGTDRDRMMGAVVGKAMISMESGLGVIEVLISLQ